MLYPKNIFLADDDRDDVEFFTDALKEIGQGFDLTVACNGQELIEKLQARQNSPDIIFIDINMPVLDGIEALSLIKKDQELEMVPAVVYSTSSNTTHISRAYESGASSYFKKPSDFRSLKNELERILSIDWGSIMRPRN